MSRRAIVVLGLAAACGGTDTARPLEGPIPDVPGVRPELTYYVKTDGGALFGGFDGALQGPIRAGDQTIVPDADGRFRVLLSGDDPLRLDAGLEYRLRQPNRAREEAVRPVLAGAGSLPNDLVIAGAGEGAYGVLVRSGDAGVSVVDLSRGLSDQGVRTEGRPFFAAVIDAERRRIAVSDFDRGRVQLIDLAAGTVERSLAPPTVVLERPFPLSRPADVDGDGTPETEVERFTARAPQAMATAGDRLLVAYTGFVSRRLDGERGPVFVPSVIASWSLDDLDAAPLLLILDALDPQELRILDDGRGLAVSSGIIDQRDGVHPLSEGALTFFDPVTLAVTDRIGLGDFAPGSALIAAGRIVVASLASARLQLRSGETTEEVALNDEAVDSVFRLVDLGGGLVGVPSFDTDLLHILDARTGELDPAPFFSPLVIGPGRPVFDGLQIVARRPGRRGVDFVGPDLLALMGIASELVPIELRKVLGP